MSIPELDDFKCQIYLFLDGYENQKEHDDACREFINERLNITASCLKIEEYNSSDYISKAHAVEVLAIRLGYLDDRPFLTEEETLSHYEDGWKSCTSETWNNFRNEKRAEAKQILGVK